MKRRPAILPALVGLSIIGVPLVAGGCQSGTRGDRPAAHATSAPAPGHAEALAGADADRAKADLDRQERDSRTRPPAAPPAHAGSRAVDQPRR